MGTATAAARRPLGVPAAGAWWSAMSTYAGLNCSFAQASSLILGVDLVLMTIHGGRLLVLLDAPETAPRPGEWGLPGRLLGKRQSVEETAEQVLREDVGLASGIELEPCGIFSAVWRYPTLRVVSAGYVAAVPAEQLLAAAATREHQQLAEFRLAWGTATLWLGDKKIRPVWDHSQIIAAGLVHLRRMLDCTMVPFRLLGGEFTLLQLQQVYEIILGEALVKPLFRKRMLARHFEGGKRLVGTGRLAEGGAHRPAELYCLQNVWDWRVQQTAHARTGLMMLPGARARPFSS